MTPARRSPPSGFLCERTAGTIDDMRHAHRVRQREAQMSRVVWFVLAVLFAVGSWEHVACAAGPIQTQMVRGDIEVDVIKAAVREGILTVVLAFRTTGTAGAQVRAPLDATYYLENSEKKKYQVLRDSKDAWIAAPVNFGQLWFDMNPGEQKPAWFKFPAPPDRAKTIDLIISTLLFEQLPVTR
jgi:hypothetical protein